MKTEATRFIEDALAEYNPDRLSGIKLNQFRDRFYAYEVPVEHGTSKGGIVDFIRVDEYFDDVKKTHCCAGRRREYWESFGKGCGCNREYDEFRRESQLLRYAKGIVP